MDCFTRDINEDSMLRCPFLRNINEPTNFSFSSPLALPMPVRGAKGPIFEDGPNFDLAFRLFHGSDGVVPLSDRSFRHSEKKVQPEPPKSQFNPLAAKAATISLSSFGFGGPFGFDAFSEKWNNQKRKSKSSKNEPSSQVNGVLETVVAENPAMGTDKPSRVGLIISTTPSIRVFLSGASKDATLSDKLRQASADLLLQSEVPYAPLRAVWMASDPSTRPDLTRLFSGTRLIFSSPKPREKSEELKARLRKLEDLAERKAYQELVKDIAPPKDVPEPFSSYKDQLGFGLHVVVTMFTGYLLGYAAFRALFNHSPAMNAAGGILGLVGAMFVETFLFIIRSSNADTNKTKKISQKSRSSFSTPSSTKKNQ